MAAGNHWDYFTVRRLDFWPVKGEQKVLDFKIWICNLLNS